MTSLLHHQMSINGKVNQCPLYIVWYQSFIQQIIRKMITPKKLQAIGAPESHTRNMNDKAKKNKSYVSKLPRAFVFQCIWFSKIQSLIFSFACLIFFPVFYELSCQNIQEKIWQTQWNTLNNRLLQLCVLSCILFIQKSSSIFHSCDWLKSDTSAAQGKKKKKRLKKHI